MAAFWEPGPESSVRKVPLVPDPPSHSRSENLPSMTWPTQLPRIETAFMA